MAVSKSSRDSLEVSPNIFQETEKYNPSFDFVQGVKEDPSHHSQDCRSPPKTDVMTKVEALLSPVAMGCVSNLSLMLQSRSKDSTEAERVSIFEITYRSSDMDDTNEVKDR